MQTLPLLLSVLTLVTVGATFLATRQTKRTMLETCLTREDMASFGGGLTDNLTRSLTDTLLRALVASDPVKHELEAACHRAFANALHVLSIEIDDEEIEKIANVVVENMTEAWLQSGALDVDAPVAPSAPMTWPARPAPQAVAAGLETIEPAPHRVMHGGELAYQGPSESHAKLVEQQLRERHTGEVQRFAYGTLVEPEVPTEPTERDA